MEKKPRKSAKTRTPKTKPAEPVQEVAPAPETPVEAVPPVVVVDPIGDVLDGEGKVLLADDAPSQAEPDGEENASEPEAASASGGLSSPPDSV